MHCVVILRFEDRPGISNKNKYIYANEITFLPPKKISTKIHFCSKKKYILVNKIHFLPKKNTFLPTKITFVTKEKFCAIFFFTLVFHAQKNLLNFFFLGIRFTNLTPWLYMCVRPWHCVGSTGCWPAVLSLNRWAAINMQCSVAVYRTQLSYSVGSWVWTNPAHRQTKNPFSQDRTPFWKIIMIICKMITIIFWYFVKLFFNFYISK